MKTFQGIKNCDTIKRQCDENGWYVDTERYDSFGDDYIRFTFKDGDMSANVLYNTFNGTFFGETECGKKFNSGSSYMDNESWFSALLNFVYVSNNDGGSAKR